VVKKREVVCLGYLGVRTWYSKRAFLFLAACLILLVFCDGVVSHWLQGNWGFTELNPVVAGLVLKSWFVLGRVLLVVLLLWVLFKVGCRSDRHLELVCKGLLGVNLFYLAVCVFSLLLCVGVCVG
jgi:hypothetical protein